MKLTREMIVSALKARGHNDEQIEKMSGTIESFMDKEVDSLQVIPIAGKREAEFMEILIGMYSDLKSFVPEKIVFAMMKEFSEMFVPLLHVFFAIALQGRTRILLKLIIVLEEFLTAEIDQINQEQDFPGRMKEIIDKALSVKEQMLKSISEVKSELGRMREFDMSLSNSQKAMVN